MNRILRQWLTGASTAATLLLALPAAANGPISSTPVLGGGGGRPFNTWCGQGEVMTGVAGRTGAWLDAIAPVCSGYGHGPGFDRPRRAATSGGGGGGPASQDCPVNAAVRGWEIGQIDHKGLLVAYVRLLCVSLATGEEFRNGPRFGRQDFVADKDVMTYRCPPGQVAMGIYGQSGSYVDNAGLRCGTPSLVFGKPVRK